MSVKLGLFILSVNGLSAVIEHTDRCFDCYTSRESLM